MEEFQDFVMVKFRELMADKITLQTFIDSFRRQYRIVKSDPIVNMERLNIGGPKKRGRPMTSNPTASTLRVRAHRERLKKQKNLKT